MAEEYVGPTETPKKSKAPLIISIVVAVVLCCVCSVLVTLGVIWQMGDQVIELLQGISTW